MTSRLFFVMSHDHTRSQVQRNPQPKRPQDFSGKLEVGGILNFFQLTISFFRVITTSSPIFFPASVPNIPRFWSRKNVWVFGDQELLMIFQVMFFEKTREQAGSDSSPFPGFRGFNSSQVVGAPGAPMAAPPRTPVSVEGLVFGQPMVL